jgi:hypothetical protein
MSDLLFSDEMKKWKSLEELAGAQYVRDDAAVNEFVHGASSKNPKSTTRSDRYSA